MPFKYIGRTTDFKGRSLWEIVGNLKNFGIDRMIARNMFQRYPEPSYMQIVKVEALPNIKEYSYDEKRKIIALVEKTFRGMKQQKHVQLESATYKTDYFLVPKYKESKFDKPIHIFTIRIFPSKMKFPPLLKEFAVHQMKVSGSPTNKELKMKIKYNRTGLKTYRVAQEGEIPTEEEPHIGLGKPVASRLFENIQK